MSSKTTPQQSQQMPWRLAASKPYRPNDRQSSPHEQQQQSGPRNGFKPETRDKSGQERSGSSGPDRPGRNGSSAALTPSSRTSTKPLMNDPSTRMNPSAFDAANNMMPSFARNRQRHPSPNQQHQTRPPPPNAGFDSIERNGSKEGHHTQNKDDKAITSRRRSSQENNEQRSDSRNEREQRTDAGLSDGEDMAKSKRAPTPTAPSQTPTSEKNEREKTKDKPAENSVVSASPSPQPIIKHPLKNRWAMWYFKNDKSKDWKDNQRNVYSFDTVEDFWALYNHMLQPSELQSGCDYSLFKEGIEPMWEDASNKNGGRWLINSMKQQRQYFLDRFWMETLLILVGEVFEAASDEVCGTVINIRPKGDKLGIWTRDAEEQEKNMVIGRGLREKLGLPKQVQLGFQAHKDTITKYGSITPNKYFA